MHMHCCLRHKGDMLRLPAKTPCKQGIARLLFSTRGRKNLRPQLSGLRKSLEPVEYHWISSLVFIRLKWNCLIVCILFDELVGGESR